jgi:hypothetical protein
MMSVDKILRSLADLILDESKRNPEFRSRLEKLFDEPVSRQRSAPSAPADTSTQKRGNRRAMSLVDPIAESGRGEANLREKLVPLTLEQLLDVVADFRMDASKLVMKWKDRERIINHIVETALSRGQKGDVFRT